MRVLNHLVVFCVGAGLALTLGFWGVTLSLATFAPGGDVTFTAGQERQAAIGDAILTVFDWPSRHILGQYRNWAFSSVCFGAVFLGACLGLRMLWRKCRPGKQRSRT